MSGGDATVAGITVVNGNLSEGRIGNWQGEFLLELAGEQPAPTGLAEFNLLGTTWQGYIQRSGEPYQQARVRMVGGKGKLRDKIPARDYRVCSYLQVIQETIEDAGEEINTTDSVGRFDIIDGWSRFNQRMIIELGQLIALRSQSDGTCWRMGRDGRIIVAPPVVTDVTQSLILVGDWPQEARRMYALEDEADGVNIFAGQRLEPGVLIDRIDWTIIPKKTRLTVWTVPE